ncbi:GHMP kinase [Clohesyomyces aquaticus]|uniref:GHMP kinase n=1 Tax=Clohesyomyces aquaticus TaxID=1231657 RepID=A0A1Y1ZF46_9PLEO|nr:GHMP kinase [Clohesyomyces aquaticus]
MRAENRLREHFPTAAGLASSAAGFAALVRAIANLYELPASPTELSRIARQGLWIRVSEFVWWPSKFAPASHWPEMRALILVVSAAKKGVFRRRRECRLRSRRRVCSRRGRPRRYPRRMLEMQKRFRRRIFEGFGKVTMMDSNSFHATCLDTYPPIFYLNDVSRAAIKTVECINAATGKIVAAYTFDAGPNAVIYYLEENEKAVVGVFKAMIGGKDGWKGARGEKVEGTRRAWRQCKGCGVAVDLLKEGVSRIILMELARDPRRRTTA